MSLCLCSCTSRQAVAVRNVLPHGMTTCDMTAGVSGTNNACSRPYGGLGLYAWVSGGAGRH